MTEIVPLPLCRVHPSERRELGYRLGGQISATKGRGFYVIYHAPQARVLYKHLARGADSGTVPTNFVLELKRFKKPTRLDGTGPGRKWYKLSSGTWG